jgi:1-acyl-sn-glycerol-3-phosphate acyltransferase
MLRAGAAIAALAAVTLVLLPFQWLSVRLALPARRRIPTFYHRIVCVLAGVRVHVVGERLRAHPLLIVSNHVSWLDIAVVTAVAPVVFVAKSEVAGWPVFGLLARLQRTVFVDRARRHKTAEVNAQIGRRLADGDPVALFAEGTSSDGNRVLPFRSALIGAARDALAEAEHAGRVWLQPLSIAYVGADGLPMGRRRRPLAAWYGSLDLVPHLIALLRHGAIDVVVSWGDPIAYDESSDRKALTRQLETTVRRLTCAALHGRLAQPARAA